MTCLTLSPALKFHCVKVIKATRPVQLDVPPASQTCTDALARTHGAVNLHYPITRAILGWRKGVGACVDLPWALVLTIISQDSFMIWYDSDAIPTNWI